MAEAENKKTETAAATKKAAATETRDDNESIVKVYIGPGIPSMGLRYAQILKGTETELSEFFDRFDERYPEVRRLAFEPSKLTEALNKVRKDGTILHKYYEDCLAKSQSVKRGG